MRLPDFVVIGAMKAGTTSLYHYLRQHPAVFMPFPKEVDFFYDRGRWQRGTAWYASLFSDASDAQVAGEASPNYTKTHLVPEVPARMGEAIPEARLVYCVRDPVERIRSHHVHVLAERAAERASKRGGGTPGRRSPARTGTAGASLVLRAQRALRADELVRLSDRALPRALSP